MRTIFKTRSGDSPRSEDSPEAQHAPLRKQPIRMPDKPPFDFDHEERDENRPSQPASSESPTADEDARGDCPYTEDANADIVFLGDCVDTPSDRAEMVMDAELVAPRRPMWPAFVTVIGAIGVAVILSTLALLAAAAITGNFQTLRNPETRVAWIKDFSGSSAGLLVLVLPGQIAFALFAIGGALLSRDRWIDRLGLRKGRLPTWTWPLFLIGTPIIGTIGGQLMSGASDKPSESLKMIEQLLQFDSIGSLLTLLLLISFLPGVVEELLFRGFLQRRLLTRLPTSAAIIICSVFFAAAHMDPIHALGVLPLGLWLGVVAWRADSIWPAVLGHIGNNAYAIVLTKVMGTGSNMEQANPAVMLVLAASLLACAGCIVTLIAAGPTARSQPNEK